MRYKNGNFPYPVLRSGDVSIEYRDDFDNTQTVFYIAIKELSTDGFDKKLNFSDYDFDNNYYYKIEIMLSGNDEIESLLKKELAGFMIHIESPLTKFRSYHIIKSDSFSLKNNYKENFIIEVSKSNIGNVLEVSSYIVALKNISSYKPSNLSPEIEAAVGKDLSIKLNKGSIIAVGDNYTWREKEEEKDINSVIKISNSINTAFSKYSYIDLEGDIIVISLTNEDYQTYVKLGKGEFARLMISIVIYPAMIYILERMYDDYKREGDHQYKDRQWYKVIENTLKTHNKTIDSVESEGSFLLAQTIFKYPITESFSELNLGIKEGNNE